MVTLKEVTESFFQELDQAFPSFANHMLISQYAFDEAWPTWEIHPKGDELVLLLSGDTDLVLGNPDGSETVMRVAGQGDYVVVPKGTWHTARPHEPTSLLFMTPGEGTLNALTPGGDPV
jgi:mannose-6-phosphate isomerase-like protein (cupin superfamily)